MFQNYVKNKRSILNLAIILIYPSFFSFNSVSLIKLSPMLLEAKLSETKLSTIGETS
jgi:hypothetical protein